MQKEQPEFRSKKERSNKDKTKKKELRKPNNKDYKEKEKTKKLKYKPKFIIFQHKVSKSNNKFNSSKRSDKGFNLFLNKP